MQLPRSRFISPFPADDSLLPPGARVLAAVSGGADSMALLCWLLSLHREVVVGHVHHDLHELRNGACDADAEFVRRQCRELKVPFAARQIELARRNGHVNEAVARDGRYQALWELAREADCPFVATAHTADDGLETALLNLMRGAAPGGWSGFAPARKLGVGVALVRPFWRTARAATRALLLQNGWTWREDESNRDPLFRRNRVRHEVLPILGDIAGRGAGDIAAQHARGAQIARDESGWMEKMAQEALEELVLKRDAGLLALDGLAFAALDGALQRRVARLAARAICPDLRDLSFEKVEALRLHVLAGNKRQVWCWRGDLRVEWTGAGAGNRLRFWRVRNQAR